MINTPAGTKAPKQKTRMPNNEPTKRKSFNKQKYSHESHSRFRFHAH